VALDVTYINNLAGWLADWEQYRKTAIQSTLPPLGYSEIRVEPSCNAQGVSSPNYPVWNTHSPYELIRISPLFINVVNK